jgi:hypothetical protein
MPAPPDWYGPVAALVGGSTVASLITLWWQRRKSTADAIAADAGTSEKLFDQIRELRVNYLKADAAREECDRQCAGMRTELQTLRSLLPAAMLSERVERLSPSLLAVLDGASDGWVISTPSDGATWLFANSVICRALKMPLADVLAKGWRGLIAPEDLEVTTTVESGQWGETVTCVNVYVAVDGTRVKLRWLGMRYAGGMALSLARVVPLLPP